MPQEHIDNHSQRWQETQEFFRVAVAEEAYLNPPKRSGLNSSRWAETRNLLGVYLYTSLTLKDIGTRYQITRENVRQRIKNGCRDIHSQCLPETQKRYPLSEMILAKPIQLPSRERRSASRGGLSVKIKSLIQAGTTAEEIIRLLNITSVDLADSRRTLKKWGSIVPYRVTDQISLAEKIQIIGQLKDPASTDEQIQKILDRVTATVYEMAIKEEHGGAICSIEGVLKTLGIKHNRVEQIGYRDILKRARIPMGELSKIIISGSQAGRVQVYHYIATQHLERAGQALVIP